MRHISTLRTRPRPRYCTTRQRIDLGGLMRLPLISAGWAIGLLSLTAACSRTHERNVESRPYVPTAAEQRRIDERRAEERLAEERREDDRRAEERRAADRRA